MMNYQINKKMTAAAVSETAQRLHISDDEMWALYYETGNAYIDDMRERIKRKRVFDVMFRPLLSLPGFGELGVQEAFEMICVASPFWFWWAVQFWAICRTSPATKDELIARMNAIDALIPNFILKQIFSNGKKQQESGCRPRKAGALAAEAGKATAAKRGATKEVGAQL